MPPQPKRLPARPPGARRPSPRIFRIRNAALAGALALLLAMDLGLSDADAASVRTFLDGVARWQVNPEFRAVALEYSIRASGAMRIRPAMVPARRVIMAARSLPLLPKSFAVNPTSALHYRQFSTGPLSAYLHLCSEQDMPGLLPFLEALGRRGGATDADLRAFLELFKLDFPVVKDAGGGRSVDSLLKDADAGRPFAVRSNVNALLLPHVAAIALGLGVPADPARMTPDQQLAVLERLDGYVHRHDPELWRTKQVSDFCGGIWAQVFGPPYKVLLVPALALHAASRFVLAVLAAGMVGASLRRRRLAGAPAESPAEADADPPSPPVERSPRRDVAPV